jgi:hypothetical protein
MTSESIIQKQRANCRAQLDFFIDAAKETLMMHGNHVPMFFIERKPDGLAIVVPDFRDDAAKDASVRSVKAMLQQFESDFFVHTSEAWMITRMEEDAIVRPSTAPDRHEVIMITFNQRDGKMVEIMMPFDKGDCGKIVFGKPVEHYSGFGAGDDFKSCGGRFAELRRW